MKLNREAFALTDSLRWAFADGACGGARFAWLSNKRSGVTLRTDAR